VITLPSAGDAPVAAPASEPPTQRPVLRQESPHVLVVDDNDDAASLLAVWLGRQGYQTSVANDGFEALTMVRATRPQIALLDLGLPVLDGYELAERLLAEPSLAGLKLVAVTGYGQEQDRERTARAGFHAHLVKPVNLQELAALLARLS
jgi:CheY-like chemotaxis protein